MKLGVIGGAGLLGSTSAFLAGMKGYLEEIKLVDIKENLVKNHVMDMGQAVYSASKTKISFGSNSDLVLENTITGNLLYTIPRFAEEGEGKLTFPTKFHMVEPLLDLDHRGKVIFRMSVNPQPIIRKIELGTSGLRQRIEAVNQMCEAGYPCGLLIAPVILVEGWKEMYTGLLEELRDGLSDKMKSQMFLEIILMTYSYVHRASPAPHLPKSEAKRS